MYTKIIFASFFCLIQVQPRHLWIGKVSKNARRLFSKQIEAKIGEGLRTDYVNINAPKGEFISGIFVTDLTKTKDGEVFLDDGGVAFNHVSIGLRSAKFLKAFRFMVEIYSSPWSPPTPIPYLDTMMRTPAAQYSVRNPFRVTTTTDSHTVFDVSALRSIYRIIYTTTGTPTTKSRTTTREYHTRIPIFMTRRCQY